MTTQGRSRTFDAALPLTVLGQTADRRGCVVSSPAGSGRGGASSDPASADQCETAREANRVLAELPERARRRALIVERFADEAEDAAESCAARYESLMPASQPSRPMMS